MNTIERGLVIQLITINLDRTLNLVLVRFLIIGFPSDIKDIEFVQ